MAEDERVDLSDSDDAPRLRPGVWTPQEPKRLLMVRAVIDRLWTRLKDGDRDLWTGIVVAALLGGVVIVLILMLK